MSNPSAARTILVVAAMPIELKQFTKALSLPRSIVGGVSAYRGSVPGTDVTVLAAVIGIGPARATESMERLLASEDIAHVVMIGIAGGLDPSLQIGDLIVPEVVVDGSSGREVHPAPIQAVAAKGRLVTTDAILSDPTALDQRLRDGVVALDMETAAVGAVCEDHRIPWSAFRTISDRVQDGIVDGSTLAMTKPDGSADVLAAMKVIAKRPAIVPKLAKLARDTNQAVRVVTATGVQECRAFAAR
jgi:adenosylhomocysteine nucleosidase